MNFHNNRVHKHRSAIDFDQLTSVYSLLSRSIRVCYASVFRRRVSDWKTVTGLTGLRYKITKIPLVRKERTESKAPSKTWLKFRFEIEPI